MEIGTRIGDRYDLIREIGRGGMATVYLADDARHARRVAIKVMHADPAHVVGSERFLREIETTAGLQHPHILPLYDSGAHGGLPYYVMPYVEGESLGERLKREPQLPVAEALEIASEVADALSHAHEKGIVHRDIKPANILLREGHALVADFGIARAVTAASDDQLTETGMVIGTIAYMSPEQSAAEPVDGRSDIYALGCLLYAMLAGEPPFAASTPQAMLAKRLRDPVPDVRTLRESVPDHVADAISTALARSPADRFATAADFAAALRGGAARLQPRRRPRRRARTIGVAITATGLAVAGGWLVGKASSLSTRDRGEVSPDVLAAYRSGREYMGRLTPAELQRAVDYFEVAIAGDSTFAPAWADLAWTWIARQQMGFVAPDSATPIAVRAANRAVALDSLLPQAHYAVAVADGWAAWNWTVAESELRRAIALDPQYADARSDLSHVLMVLHRPAEAVAQIDTAVSIEPENPKYRLFQAAVYTNEGRFAEAREGLSRVLDVIPDNEAALTILAGINYLEGRYEEAVAIWLSQLRGGGLPGVAEELSTVYARDGFVAAARATADSLASTSATRFVPPVMIAGFYVTARDTVHALDWLEIGKNRREPNLPYIGVNLPYAFLHGHPRFEAILRALHLPPSEPVG